MKVSALLIAASVASTTTAFAPVSRAATSSELKASFLDNLIKKETPAPEPVVEEKASFFDSLINNKKTSAKIPAKATKKAPVKAAPERSFSLFAKSNNDAAPVKKASGKTAFSTISNLDLWAPVKDSNDYGGRSKKNIKTGKLTDKSYVPSGLTRAQYEKIRKDADAKKAANYQKNVAKAGVFEDYTQFYLKRGTEENGSWMSMPNRGHRMAKTKFDWSMSGSESREQIESNGNGKR